jgi:hypothetical protein
MLRRTPLRRAARKRIGMRNLLIEDDSATAQDGSLVTLNYWRVLARDQLRLGHGIRHRRIGDQRSRVDEAGGHAIGDAKALLDLAQNQNPAIRGHWLSVGGAQDRWICVVGAETGSLFALLRLSAIRISACAHLRASFASRSHPGLHSNQSAHRTGCTRVSRTGIFQRMERLVP